MSWKFKKKKNVLTTDDLRNTSIDFKHFDSAHEEKNQYSMKLLGKSWPWILVMLSLFQDILEGWHKQTIWLLPNSVEIVSENIFSSDTPKCSHRELHILST